MALEHPFELLYGTVKSSLDQGDAIFLRVIQHHRGVSGMLMGLKPPSWFLSSQLIQDSPVRMILRATQGPFRGIGV